MEDVSAFFDDGIPISASIAGNDFQSRGFLDRPTEEAFGGSVSVTHWELRYATDSLPGLVKNQTLLIDGQQFKTTEPPRQLFDGATSVISLTRL